MSTEKILTMLIEERNKLDAAIKALRAGGPESGNPKSTEAAPKKKRHLSAEVRRRMALGQQKRWAALKAAK